MKRSLNLFVLVTLFALTFGAMSGKNASASGLPAPATAFQFFSNLATITINDLAPASPYPSNISVSGFVSGSVITNVSVVLYDVTHNCPIDLDVVLVGPGGQTVQLMSDVGDCTDVIGADFYIYDTAPGPFPSVSPLTGGDYQPSNYSYNCAASDNSNLPAPAPASPYGTALSAFNGSNPNGTWSLYVYDDCASDIGSIAGGWTINITANAPAVGLSAASLNFGNQLVGVTSAPQTVTVTNTGDADLHIGLLSINSDFGLSNDTCSNATVAPTNSCTFDVLFQPLSLGPKAGQVSIPSDAASSPDIVSLDGTGVAIPAGVNLLKKPDFATANIFPTPWKLFGVKLPYASALDCTFFNTASCSVYFPSGNRSAMQVVNRSGLAGDLYFFGLSSAATNVPSGGKYLVEVAFYNNFNRPVGLSQLIFNIGTHGFELESGFAFATGDYNKIIFRFYYQNATGRAWFDDAFLMVAP